MAFLVNLEILELIDIQLENIVPEVEENLAKLISFSRSLTSLNLADSALVHSISPNFCNALGHSISLQSLVLDHNSALLDAQILGRAVAINSRLKHPLRQLSLKKGVLGHQQHYESFIQALYWSESYDTAAQLNEFKICGSEPYVEPDGSEEHLHCSLHSLVIQGRLGQSYTFQKAKTEHSIKKCIERQKFYEDISSLSISDVDFKDEEALLNSWNSEEVKLTSLSLRHNGLKISEKFGTALPKSLRVLDLSGNNISDSGIRAMAPFLHESEIEYLNLFQNNLTIESARYLEAAFRQRARLRRLAKKISSLRCVDFGYNRFRDKGSLIILRSLLAYCSELRVINLRYNFITTKGCLSLLQLNEMEEPRPLCLSLLQNKIEDTSKIKQKLKESPNPLLRVDLSHKYDTALFEPETILVTGFPLSTQETQLTNTFHEAGCRGVSSVRIRVKRSQKGVKTGIAFIEMRDKHAARQALHLASSQRLLLNGKRLKAYRAKESV